MTVVLVEHAGEIFSVLQKNLQTICPQDDYKLVKTDVRQFVKTTIQQFDIIIADPPYNSFKFFEIKDMVDPLLAPGGIFCMEMAVTPILSDQDLRIKKYGRTQVVFWEKQK